MALKFYLITSALLILLLASLRDDREAVRADMTYVNQSDVNTLDPATMTWMQDFRIALNIWEGLTWFDPTVGRAVSGAAFPPMVSKDELTYTFSLRDDLRWSNGDAVTAHDFVRGWRRAIEPGTAGDYSFLLTKHIAGAQKYFDWRMQFVASRSMHKASDASSLEALRDHATAMNDTFAGVGIRATTDLMLEIRLSNPCFYLEDLLALPVFLPVHENIELLRIRFEDLDVTREGLVAYDPQWTKPDYFANSYTGLVTNGPYCIKNWEFKRGLRMVVNPHFRDVAAIQAKTIDMIVYRNLNAALLAYEADQVDFMPDTSVSYDHELIRLGRDGFRSDFANPPVLGSYYYIFNCAPGASSESPNPFADPRVRRAFALATNRALIVDRVMGRGAPVIASLVPPGGIPDYTPPNGLTHDPKEARRLMAEAGYPNGSGMPVVDLLYNTGFDHGKVCDALAAMWARELGVVVAPRGKEIKTFAEDRKTGRFMIARAGWYGDYADPTTFLDVFASGNGNNDAGFTDAHYDSLLNSARGARDKRHRMEKLRAAESILVHDALPLIPICQYTQLLAIKPHVKGLIPNSRLRFPFRRLAIER
jgi:oligopeptide transport system substrate-binding protein